MLLEKLAEEKYALKAEDFGNACDAQAGIEQHLAGGIEAQINDILIGRCVHDFTKQRNIA